MNLVSQRKTTEEERYRMTARLSILESIKQQLESTDALSSDELDRLKKLAKNQYEDADADSNVKAGVAESKAEVKWSDIFRGTKPAETETTVNKWDKQDIETRMF